MIAAAEAFDFEALFTQETPRIDDSLIDFDQALKRAAENVSDDEAFAAMNSHFKAAEAQGDLTAIYTMAMTIGAMACLHDHLQTYADEVSSLLSPDSHKDGDGHQHEKHKDSPKSEEKKKKSKKKEAVNWFAWLFARP
jgi:hypothetical protein